MKKITLYIIVINLIFYSCQKQEKEININCKTVGYKLPKTGQTISALGIYDAKTNLFDSVMSITDPRILNSQGCYDYNTHTYYTLVSNKGGASNGARMYAINMTNKLVDSFDIIKSPSPQVALSYNMISKKFYSFSSSAIYVFDIENIPLSYPKYAHLNSTIPIPAIPANLLFKTSSTLHSSNPYLYYAHDSNIYEVNLNTQVVRLIKLEYGKVHGLRFNINDNHLYYALDKQGAVRELVINKLNLSSNTSTEVAKLNFNINEDIHSATIDACNNEYQFYNDLGNKVLVNLNTTNTVQTIPNTTEIYQGMFWTKIK